MSDKIDQISQTVTDLSKVIKQMEEQSHERDIQMAEKGHTRDLKMEGFEGKIDAVHAVVTRLPCGTHADKIQALEVKAATQNVKTGLVATFISGLVAWILGKNI